jgi:hypothetical protein
MKRIALPLLTGVLLSPPVVAEEWRCKDEAGKSYIAKEEAPFRECSKVTPGKASSKPKKAQAPKSGVSLGMTQKEVLASSWGKPKHVNRTISRSGTREQWVYGGHNYLYFENGILTTVQN